MTLHGGFGGLWQLQGLEQTELFRGGSADAGVGLVSDGGAVLLDAPELFQCLGRARCVSGSFQAHAHDAVHGQSEEADQRMGADALG